MTVLAGFMTMATAYESMVTDELIAYVHRAASPLTPLHSRE